MLSANSLVMITKQQIRINYIEEISIKSEEKRSNIIRYQKNHFKLLAVSLAIFKKNKLELIIWKKLASKMVQKKNYQMSKKLLEAFNPFPGHDHKTTS